MLNSHDPQSQYIFQASDFEEHIRAVLVKCMKSQTELTAETRQSLVATSIAELIQLNNDHFDRDKGIRQSLDNLSETLLHEPDLSILPVTQGHR